MRNIEDEAGQTVRTWLILAGIVHAASIFLEILLYGIPISMIFSEVVFLWLTYWCYMQMSSFMIWLYIVLFAIGTAYGVFSIFDVGGWFIIYIGQLAVDAFIIFNLGKAMHAWKNSKLGVA